MPDERISVEEVTQVVASILARHVDKLHTLSEPDVAELVKEHIDMREAVELITIEMHGKKAPTVADPDRREGGMSLNVEAIAERQIGIDKRTKNIEDLVANGGITVKLTRGVRSALIAAFAIIMAALIAGIFDWIGAP